MFISTMDTDLKVVIDHDVRIVRVSRLGDTNDNDDTGSTMEEGARLVCLDEYDLEIDGGVINEIFHGA